MEGKEIKKKDYTVQVGYSKKAKKDKLIKFITKSGDEFEISSEELASFIVGGVNTETLDAAFVEVDKVNSQVDFYDNIKQLVDGHVELLECSLKTWDFSK